LKVVDIDSDSLLKSLLEFGVSLGRRVKDDFVCAKTTTKSLLKLGGRGCLDTYKRTEERRGSSGTRGTRRRREGTRGTRRSRRKKQRKKTRTSNIIFRLTQSFLLNLFENEPESTSLSSEGMKEVWWKCSLQFLQISSKFGEVHGENNRVGVIKLFGRNNLFKSQELVVLHQMIAEIIGHDEVGVVVVIPFRTDYQLEILTKF
jgi:hypothetical protein